MDMTITTPQYNKKSPKKKPVLKALIFLAFIVAAIAIFRFSPAREMLSVEVLRGLIVSAGLWAPILFIVIYFVGVCLFIPGTLLTATGAVLFGPFYGFLYNETGALIGASLAFFIGRYLGRDFASSLVGDRLKKYDDKIAEKGFATVLYMRLVFFPFVPMNFGMGLTKVRFKDYFFGTLFGILAGGFILTFFFATLSEVMISGDWGQLVSFKVFFSVALFGFSFFIPRIIRKVKGEV
ncbi:MAG: TVP38/TMEM64 family protein [Deltaproteobacteria bacterium]|nr:TVP38/TMEM64 family protein [Deltaproteobacteria bacterium]